MKRLRLPQFSKLVIAALASILILLLLLSSPLWAQTKPQAKIFEQAWQTVNDNFYDPKFNGVNWQAIREKYQPQAAQAQSNQQIAVAINQMLSQLRTSHTHFYTQDEPAYYQLLGIFQPGNKDFQQQIKKFFPKGKIEYSGIGAFTKNINGKTFVSAILDGSPAAIAGLKVGDSLLGVDGSPYQPIQSFVGKAGQKVTLLIQRSPNPKTQIEIAIAPQMLDATTMFLDAQQASTQVIERQGKKIGYVHIWSYAGDQYQQQLEEDLIYGRLKDADGLVLDLREGWGGASPNYLNIFTAKGPNVTTVLRNSKRNTVNYQWKKPVVMIVNEGSRSGKEILAFGFQKYNIGPVIGTKTAGAVVGGRPFLMQNGNLLYLAVADVFVDGNQRLEGKGVTPDINVPFSLEYAQGADPQKERAIEVVVNYLH